jgi:N-methylhydantoinase B/oxoprolinase/acetone carboxylase alpha subunit
VRAHGGGGYGDPALRDPALVEADLRDGFESKPSPDERQRHPVLTPISPACGR